MGQHEKLSSDFAIGHWFQTLDHHECSWIDLLVGMCCALVTRLVTLRQPSFLHQINGLKYVRKFTRSQPSGETKVICAPNQIGP